MEEKNSQTKPNEVAWDELSGIVVVNSQARVEQGLRLHPGCSKPRAVPASPFRKLRRSMLAVRFKRPCKALVSGCPHQAAAKAHATRNAFDALPSGLGC